MPDPLIKSKKQSQTTNKNLLFSAGIISGATLCSRLLGFLRDMIIAHMFGAEMVADGFAPAHLVADAKGGREILAQEARIKGGVAVRVHALNRPSLTRAR